MLSEVVAWEGQMRIAAGTAAADPRNPDVQAKLQKWTGDIAAMATIQLGIDPGSTVCDKFLAAIPIADSLQKIVPTVPVVGGSSGSAPLTKHCESLGDIFNRMNTQVSERFPRILAQQCQLPWLSDQYFEAVTEGRATAGAPSAARPQAAKANAPGSDQESLARRRCRALFELHTIAGGSTVHGDLVGPLVVELDSVIYREGRQAPASGK
jgi:hypothetical protein